MEYRFHLQRGTAVNKSNCPACHGKRCFRKYVDEEGKIQFPDDVGRCDHENHCGYHYTPKQFFSDHPDLKPENDYNDYIYIIMCQCIRQYQNLHRLHSWIRP